MAAPSQSVCAAWATEANVCAPCTDATADLDAWTLAASGILYELSGRRFSGECDAIVRPCARMLSEDGQPYTEGDVAGWWAWHGSWGACGCNRGERCGCGRLPEITLGGYPVASVTEVKIDGAVLAPSAYRVDNWRKLVRTDGEGWPCCQRLDLADTEDETWSVAYTYGVAPPPAGVAAAAELGCQLALACAGSGECRLPARVQQITRQGVTFVMLDPFQFLNEGRTGLYLTDLFLSAYGPQSHDRWPAVIANPDILPPVRHAGT